MHYRSSDAELPREDYRYTQCQLDLYLPDAEPGFPTLIYFHGGGLVGGKRHFPDLKNKGIALVAVGYRLSPKADCPAFLEDAAAATAWTLDHIEGFGGDPAKVFISGHSAGGYLSAMVGMDPRWLAPFGHVPNDLAGLIPVSGQVSTHFTVKKLRGDTQSQYRVVVDEYAPLTYASADLPPICLIVGDREIEYKNRVEENDLLATSLRNLGHEQVEFHEMGGLNHGTVLKGAYIIIPDFIKRTVERQSP
ncbi:alpha/beta hydrolase [Coraliomargarita parva]|uniref:alpha/beta hydrolase n=1 Tax=Coraliomargarita parva TaxID=3014050 RepID=UPI0022B5AE33|nr:alpha/beta hydrolase [Coraliomargarita parva]